MKKYIMLFVLMSLKFQAQTNYVSWDFTPSITSANYASNTTNQNGARTTGLTNVTLSTISLTGSTAVAANTLHRTTTWATSFDANKYIEFSVTLTNGDVFPNNSLSFAVLAAVSSLTAAARDYQVHYGWGASPTFALATNGTVTGVGTTASSNTATIPAPGNTTSTVLKIRIHAYNHGTGTGNFRISTMALTGADAPLPVEITNFDVLINGKNIELSWQTATETNNHGFEIERALPQGGGMGGGLEWTKIGFVEGHGTTNTPQSYSFVDASAKGTAAYRLKQIDRDGKFEYSKTVEATVAGAVTEFGLTQNYPNPFNPSTRISYMMPSAGHVSLKVYDMLGKEVASLVNGVRPAGENVVEFNASHLPSGMYIAKFRAGEKAQMIKMTLLK